MPGECGRSPHPGLPISRGVGVLIAVEQWKGADLGKLRSLTLQRVEDVLILVVGHGECQWSRRAGRQISAYRDAGFKSPHEQLHDTLGPGFHAQ